MDGDVSAVEGTTNLSFSEKRFLKLRQQFDKKNFDAMQQFQKQNTDACHKNEYWISGNLTCKFYGIQPNCYQILGSKLTSKILMHCI